jgi:hypothetical protein
LFSCLPQRLQNAVLHLTGGFAGEGDGEDFFWLIAVCE